MFSLLFVPRLVLVVDSLKLSDVQITRPLQLLHLHLHLHVLLLQRVVPQLQDLLGLVVFLLRHAVTGRGLGEHGLIRISVVQSRCGCHQIPRAALTVHVDAQGDGS